jgi:PhnB protein
MSRVSTYLNFMGRAEEAFNYYRAVFGTEFVADITRMSDMPAGEGGPVPSDAEQRMVMHVALPILAGHVLMGTDLLESMGQQLRVGNNVTINLEPDTRAETEKFYAALCEGGSDATGLQDMPWGAYWGCCLDRFGVRWMFNCYESA